MNKKKFAKIFPKKNKIYEKINQKNDFWSFNQVKTQKKQGFFRFRQGQKMKIFIFVKIFKKSATNVYFHQKIRLN